MFYPLIIPEFILGTYNHSIIPLPKEKIEVKVSLKYLKEYDVYHRINSLFLQDHLLSLPSLIEMQEMLNQIEH